MSLDCNDLKPERLLVLEGVGSTDLKRCPGLQESYYSDFTIIVSATMEDRLSVPRCKTNGRYAQVSTRAKDRLSEWFRDKRFAPGTATSLGERR